MKYTAKRETAISLWLEGRSYCKIAQQLEVSVSWVNQLFKVPGAIRQALKERAEFKCENCRKDLLYGDCHHAVRDREHKLENLRYLCHRCHAHLETIRFHENRRATPEERELLRNRPFRTPEENAIAVKKHLDYLRSLDV